MTEPRALSELESKVLQVIHEQGDNRLTVPTLAEEVGCTLKTLYNLLQDESFLPLWTGAMQRSTTAAVPEILNAFEQEAKTGSFRHGKLMLEIAGVYTPKSQTEVKGSIRVDEAPFASDEERRAFLAKMLTKVAIEEGE